VQQFEACVHHLASGKLRAILLATTGAVKGKIIDAIVVRFHRLAMH